ncbi:MAG TPA: tRNA uridine-5-carboxymethylaminomethyl(34) synthesis GTPase MnmE [Burkholderiales bacterium]|nr:tRNA uridine-5-carboxymethylaminomethyl(34) synthesis GTPase MnmE [Burkholderiales bacterium]
MHRADTIAAIATGAGRAGIGVVRVSGPAARDIAGAVTARSLAPRIATFCDFLDADASILDRGIALFFPAPNSFTGEDVLELQGHGGVAVLQLVLRRCMQLGARIARPGEFSERAFLNDKLDLAQAESIADLIDAGSEAAARGAMRSLAGEFSQRIGDLVRALIDLRVLVEATLDFPEEGIDFLERAGVREKVSALRKNLGDLKEHAAQGKILRDGIDVVIVGQPNVGKSSLLNKLAQEEVAIVSDIPGTTRDALRHEILMEGVPVHIVDTAGLRDTTDAVEKIGMERTRRELQTAAIALVLMDATCGMTDADRIVIDGLPPDLFILFIFNKVDLLSHVPASSEREIYLSAKTGVGLESLRTAVLGVAGWQPSGEGLFIARERHLEALRDAQSALSDAEAANTKEPELMAEALRLAQQALGRITGDFDADALLGEIFSRFCIGK